MKTIVIAYPYSHDLGRKLASRLGAEFSEVSIQYFPDGEKLVAVKGDVRGKKAVIVNSLYNPDEKIIDICLTSDTLKDLGAKEVVLVAPYLCYMRQDKRFHRGESISSRTIAKIITPFFSKLITVDPHLHRYKSLGIIYKLKTKTVTANPLLAEYIKKNYSKAASNNVVIVGPDEESYQWAESVAKTCNADVTVCKKTRYSSRRVKVELRDKITIRGRTVVVVDDIISTGHTMVEIVKQLKKMSPKKIMCMAVHGLFVENAYEKLVKAGADEVITTNTINHKSNKIDITKIIIKEV